MTERRWIHVTELENIPEREGRAVQIGGREIAIFNLGDRLLATSNRCPHKGGPLCDGIITGAAVVCPLHAWKVSLEDGKVERPASEATRCIETYSVRVEDGVVVVAVPPAFDVPVRHCVEEEQVA
jgi:nitrite reductase (NADH) small subunit